MSGNVDKKTRMEVFRDVIDAPQSYPIVPVGMEGDYSRLGLKGAFQVGISYCRHAISAENATRSSLLWVLARACEGYIKDHAGNTPRWYTLFTAYPWRTNAIPRDFAPKIVGPDEHIKFLDAISRESNLQAQVEKVPALLARNYQCLGDFADYAEIEVKRLRRAPKFKELPLIQQDMMFKLLHFIQDYVLVNHLSPETITRFYNQSGAFEQGQLTTNRFNFMTQIELIFKALSYESVQRITMKHEDRERYGYNRDLGYDEIKLEQILNRPIFLFNKFQENFWDVDISLAHTRQAQESSELGGHETAYYIYSLGLAARRWGFHRKMTQDDANLIAEKMKRQLDFVLCSKNIEMLKMRIEQGVPEDKCFFGCTDADIAFLKKYGERLARIPEEVQLDCEKRLRDKINVFFDLHTDVELKALNRNRDIPAAGMMVNLEAKPAAEFQGEIRARYGGSSPSPYQEKVRRDLAEAKGEVPVI